MCLVCLVQQHYCNQLSFMKANEFKLEAYRQIAQDLDNKDELKHFQSYFQPIQKNLVYLEGNSLGRLPKKTKPLIDECIQKQWGHRLIRSWEEKWMNIPLQSAKIIAKLINAQSQEVCVCDNTSTNLYKLAFGVLSNTQRSIVIIDQYNFPTDQYVITGLCKQLFQHKKVVRLPIQEGKFCVDMETIKTNINEDVALLVLGYILYKSGCIYDMKQINRLADQKGVTVIWDLSHALGAIPINLKQLNCKMAVGCTYKFLNGGPGSPAFIYVQKDLIKKLNNPIKAWLGHANSFSFNKDYISNQGIQKYWGGTPNILSTVGIIPGIQVILQAGIDKLRKKSLTLSKILINIFHEQLQKVGFKLQSPLQQEKRGSFLTLSHLRATEIVQKLSDQKSGNKVFIIGYKPPCHLRIGLTALYNSHMQIVQFCQRLLTICSQFVSQTKPQVILNPPQTKEIKQQNENQNKIKQSI